jgi:hypothetical protein
MINFEDTIISQFANSPTIISLVKNINDCIDPEADLDNFYNIVWNVETARGFGLDIWGRIVGVSRNLNIPAGIINLGHYLFTPGTYVLDDDNFRTLILTKALSNITDCTAHSINRLLTNLFAGRGRCYVIDLQNMAMQYVFEFYLLPYEVAIVTSSGVVPRPVGVQSNLVQVDVRHTFGFREQVNLQPFNQGVFYAGQ